MSTVEGLVSTAQPASPTEPPHPSWGSRALVCAALVAVVLPIMMLPALHIVGAHGSG
jgi:hypothetical protein